MRKSLRILHLEDSRDDRELVQGLLESDGLVCEIDAVETRLDFQAALERSAYDLIISDFTLPSYDGMSALSLARVRQPDTPYLFVSGTLGEEQAIESLKNGATDYVLKHRLERLVPAVRRALRETEERARRKHAELLREEFAWLAQKLNSTTTPEAAARVIVQVAEKLIGWHACTLDLYAAEDDILYAVLMIDTLGGRRMDVPIRTSSYRPTPRMRRCLEEGVQLVFLDDVQVAPPREEYEAASPASAPCVVMTPIRNGAKVTGILSVEKYTGRAYDQADANTLAALADHCGGALERIWAEEEKDRLIARVQRQQRRLDNILASVPGVVWEEWRKPDPALQRTNFVSHYVEAMLGYTVEDWHSQPHFWLSIVHPEDRERVAGEVDAMFRSRKGITQQYRWIAQGGQTVWVETGASVISDEAGHALGLRGVTLDISEKKAMETQSLRSQRLESIGTLASGIAHDLNNILSPILMSTQVLRAKMLDPDSQNLLALAEASAKRGAEIVKQVLTFARGADGERILIQPKHLLEELVKILRETFPKSLTIAVDLPGDLWTLTGDPTQLHQVLLNLCVNARDAMPVGGALALKAENRLLDESCASLSPEAEPGRYVAIEVSDSGVGIPPEILDKIFDPFFTTKGVPEGTGLGLSTVLGIVRSHGGFVTVESQLGLGARFRVFLPATLEHVPELQATPVAAPPGQGEWVLVVDDEAGIRDLTRHILTSHGYNVLVAENGSEALALYERHRGQIELVVTDLMMPGLDGLAVVRGLKALNPAVKVIASSGLGSEDKLAELERLGVLLFLEKPYAAEHLANAVHHALENA